MELTWTEAIFSRITMMLFMCINKSSRNDLKLHETTFWKIYKILAKNEGQGPHHLSTRVGGTPPTSWAPWWLSDGHLLLYEVFHREKNKKQPFGMKLRRHEAEPWRIQSRAPVELFCRGNFPLRGGNHRHRHHQCSSHRDRAISINIFISTITSQNPSSSLVSNSCLQVRDWC